MLNIKKAALVSLATLVLCSVFSVSFAQEKSMREKLVESEDIAKVYAINEFYSLVLPKTNVAGYISNSIAEEFQKMCITQIEEATAVSDPITGKTTYGWKPYVYERGRNFFGVKTRCKGGYTFETKYLGDYSRMVTSFIIEHESAQPFIYKVDTVKPMSEISMLPDGEVVSIVGKEGSSGVGGFLANLTKTINKAGGNGITGHESQDLIQYMQALCIKNKGTARYVAKRASGEFVEVDSLNVFKYSLSPLYFPNFPNRIPKEWFFACSGDQRFVARVTENIRQKFSESFAVFASNRGLEGIDFTPMQKGSMLPQVTEQKQVGELPQNMQEEFAVEVAAKKTNLFKVVGAQEYVGTYNGKDNKNCDMVTVEKDWNAERKKSRKDTYNYSICEGVIAKSSETPIESLPNGIDAFSQKIARTAQKIGSADADYQGYIIKTRALRDKDQCSVEVKIYRYPHLISNKIVNGCQ